MTNNYTGIKIPLMSVETQIRLFSVVVEGPGDSRTTALVALKEGQVCARWDSVPHPLQPTERYEIIRDESGTPIAEKRFVDSTYGKFNGTQRPHKYFCGSPVMNAIRGLQANTPSQELSIPTTRGSRKIELTITPFI